MDTFVVVVGVVVCGSLMAILSLTSDVVHILQDIRAELQKGKR